MICKSSCFTYRKHVPFINFIALKWFLAWSLWRLMYDVGKVLLHDWNNINYAKVKKFVNQTDFLIEFL